MTNKPPYKKPWWIEHEEMKKRKRREARGVPDEHEKHVKRGKAAKRKGKRREDQLAKHMEKLTGEEWERRSGDNDVQPKDSASPWRSVHVECKARKAHSFVKFCHQAEGDAATHGKPRWVVAAKADQQPWYGIVDFDDYVKDMQELASLRTIVDALKLEERVREEEG